MAEIRPSINAKGFRTAVKDYTETSVIEELAANSYDANATTVIVALDTKRNALWILDDGDGFNSSSILEVSTLGGGDKSSPYATGKRVYLGSYGYGLKSTLNIADRVVICTSSTDGGYKATVDWNRLEEAIRPEFKGYEYVNLKLQSDSGTGSVLELTLKNPTDKTHLDEFGRVLSNLPSDGGGFQCYYGFREDFEKELQGYQNNFTGLRGLAERLSKAGKLSLATSIDSELEDCEIEEFKDKEDKSVGVKVYFAGLQGSKIRSLKESLRGIYIRVNGRLLKHNFSEDKFTYGISKYTSFKQGLRVELDINWLRNQVTLSRDDIKFSNEKLEKDFKQLLHRSVRRFIQPRLVTFQKSAARAGNVKLKQRLELAKKRAHNNKGVMVEGVSGGFTFVPETDAELAILLAQSDVMARIDKNYQLIDYNDQAAFDCMLYDSSRRDFIYAELEPTLVEFLAHKEKENVQLVITWSLGKWRTGARKSGVNGSFELIVPAGAKPGHYKLLEFASEKSKKPRTDYPVVVLEQTA